MSEGLATDHSMRVLDILLSLILLGVSAPILLVVALLIFLFDESPIFFVQTRLGRFGLEFRMLKFRTMVQGGNRGSFSTQENDPRITKIGRVLRLSSLDELPQLFNVLLGDMSLVGPRPDVVEQKPLYKADQLSERLSVRPGLTGCAQVKYRSNATFEQRLEADLEWVRHRSLGMYLRVIAFTITAFRSAN